MRVLVVEDDPLLGDALCIGMRRSLHAFGHAGADHMPARPCARQFRLALHAPQQEARGIGPQFAVHQGGKLFAQCLAHGSLTFASDNSGRSFSSIASRARKMRERTVPIGQFIFSAISS